jgi:hypothetical protein
MFLMRVTHCSQQSGAFARLTLALAILMPVSTASAQDTTCSYDACALSLEGGFFGRRIVRGVRREKVATLGFLPALVPALALASDSAGSHYRAYRRKAESGFVFSSLGIGFAVAGLLVSDPFGPRSRTESRSTTLFVGATVSFYISGWFQSAAEDDLARAVFWYNRSLRSSPPAKMPDS